MRIINLTPHTVNIVDAEGNPVRNFASEGIARAATSSVVVGELDGIELVKTTFGAPVGLPDPEDGVYLIVSLATATAAKDHGRSTDDLLLTSDPVRDSEGRIVGCLRLAKV